MKKYITVSFLVISIIVFSANDTFARGKKFKASDHYLNLSLFIFYPASIGYKHLVSRNMYLTGNLDYVDCDKDLLCQTGAAYMIPRKILFLRVYGGGGLEFSRNHGYLYPYVMIGSNFWILFTEIVHPLRSERDPRYRLGFSFSF